MNLPIELRSSEKGLINIKNKDQKCFLSFHVKHINPLNENSEGILKSRQKNAKKNLIMIELSFLCKKKILTKSR